MRFRCSLVVTGNDQKDARHKTRQRLAALVAMIAIVLGAAIWSGTMFAQGNGQIRSDLDWILHDHDIQRDLTLNGLRSQAYDIGKVETDGDALPLGRCQSVPPVPRCKLKDPAHQPRIGPAVWVLPRRQARPRTTVPRTEP